MMSGVRSIAELRVFAGGTLGADRFQIDRREDGVLGFGPARSSFLEQRYRGLAAARAMKDVDIQVRHDGSPVVGTSICLGCRLTGGLLRQRRSPVLGFSARALWVFHGSQ